MFMCGIKINSDACRVSNLCNQKNAIANDYNVELLMKTIERTKEFFKVLTFCIAISLTSSSSKTSIMTDLL